jgi:hypothetical protein
VLPDTAQSTEFSSGSKYIRLTNPLPYLEEEEGQHNGEGPCCIGSFTFIPVHRVVELPG